MPSRKSRRQPRHLPLCTPRFSRLSLISLPCYKYTRRVRSFSPLSSLLLPRDRKKPQRRRRHRSSNLHRPRPLHHPVRTRNSAVLLRHRVALVSSLSCNPRSSLVLRVHPYSSPFLLRPSLRIFTEFIYAPASFDLQLDPFC